MVRDLDRLKDYTNCLKMAVTTTMQAVETLFKNFVKFEKMLMFIINNGQSF